MDAQNIKLLFCVYYLWLEDDLGVVIGIQRVQSDKHEHKNALLAIEVCAISKIILKWVQNNKLLFHP